MQSIDKFTCKYNVLISNMLSKYLYYLDFKLKIPFPLLFVLIQLFFSNKWIVQFDRHQIVIFMERSTISLNSHPMAQLNEGIRSIHRYCWCYSYRGKFQNILIGHNGLLIASDWIKCIYRCSKSIKNWHIRFEASSPTRCFPKVLWCIH